MPMPQSSPSGRVLRFGVFEVDLAAGELRKSGVRIRLQEQPFQVLTFLLSRPGDVITREELAGMSERYHRVSGSDKETVSNTR